MNVQSLEIRLLEAFAAVMSAGSMTAAAKLLDRSQPVVTRDVQALEASIGYALFDRVGPRLVPTRRGIQFHAEVERLLVGLRHLRTRSAEIGAGALPMVSVAAVPALAAGLVPEAIAGVDPALLPQQVHTQSLAAEGVVQSVLGRSADIGLASLPFDSPGLDILWTAEAPCVACLAADHPLARNGTVALRQLAPHRLLTLSNPYRLRGRIDAALDRVNVQVERVIETNSSLQAISLARLGLGVAIVEPVLACFLPLSGVVVRKLDVAIPFGFATVCSVATEMTPSLSAVDAALREAASRIPGVTISGVR
jgi:DNA-binding transcriptional LysR family regulator